MRYLVVLVFCLLTAPLWAQAWEDRRVFSAGEGIRKLRILSSTDTTYVSDMIAQFVTENSDVEIEYLVTGTSDIFDLVQDGAGAFDLVMSSAMDLQFKLVNDGFALRLNDLTYPQKAQWRQSLFGFSAEPAAIVVNTKALTRLGLPHTRQDLIKLLRTHPELFFGRIATYDIRSSGLGYLFAAQDARTSETYWRLTEVMGGLGARLYCCSGEMIDAVARGDMLVAYNVLGSYAAARALNTPAITVIEPGDFTTTMMRTVFVSRTAENPELAALFLKHALTYVRQDHYAQTGPLPQLMGQSDQIRHKTIPLEPSLMVYLDKLKRQAFVREWESAIIQ